MPVVNDFAHLNSVVGDWCMAHCPEYLGRVTGIEFHSVIRQLIEIGDTYEAVRKFEKVAGVRANENLFRIMCTPGWSF